MIHWGCCKEKIVAYRKQEGNLVKFDDRSDPDTNDVIAEWYDWIENINSSDVRLLEPSLCNASSNWFNQVKCHHIFLHGDFKENEM